MVEPPVPAPPSVHVAVSVPDVPVAPLPDRVAPPGGKGTAAGTPTTFDAEAVEAAPVPKLFVAVTVTVYDVPSVKPVRVHDVDGGVAVQVKPPGEEVAV